MEVALTAAAAGTLMFWLAYALDAWRGRQGILDLRRPSRAEDRSVTWPRVSVVVAARNEELAIEPAVRSLLALDYPDFDLLVIDDRSEDRTSEILARIAAERGRLRLVRIEEVPDGWLGKNHALAVGAAASDGELILFTDADVVFAPNALSRAVEAMCERRLDHIAGAVDVVARGPALQLFVVAFALVFNGYLRPWRAADPDSSAAVGIGAFNLVRRSAYEAIGGHEPIRMRPDDDLRLGMALKSAGYRQQLGLLGALGRVEWYPDLRSAVVGLEKNSLAAVDYRLWQLVAGNLGLLAFAVAPFPLALLLVGPPALLYAASALLVVLLAWGFVRETRLPAWTALGVPIGVLLVVFTTSRAALLTLLRGGIRWRGTFYPLRVLRARSDASS